MSTVPSTGSPTEPTWPASRSSGSRTPVVEHLCGLDQLPLHGFTFSAVPPMVVGFGTFPVRAYARVG
jgi:arylformamidase